MDNFLGQEMLSQPLDVYDVFLVGNSLCNNLYNVKNQNCDDRKHLLDFGARSVSSFLETRTFVFRGR